MFVETASILSPAAVVISILIELLGKRALDGFLKPLVISIVEV
jgi:hypothetical protein